MAVTKTYGSNIITGTEATVTSGGTVQISRAFEASVGIVGGMDASNGNASAGSIERVGSVSQARDLFGDGSELHEQVALAYANGVDTVHAVGVTETTGTTESFTGTQSGTLDNVPFDPNVNTEHSISAQDTTEATSVTVNIVYNDTVSAPSASNEMNLNPTTGDWKADASSDYDITYDYGDYTTPIEDMVATDVRFVVVCSEDEANATTLGTQLGNEADTFEFRRGVIGGYPKGDSTTPSSFASNYSDNISDQRIVVVEPPRGTNTDDTTVRTMGAVGGRMASRPLGVSATGDNLGGLNGLRVEFTDQDAKNLAQKDSANSGVTPLRDTGAIELVVDMTSSTDQKFERVYACEIIDEAVLTSYAINKSFISLRNVENNRSSIRESHKTAFGNMQSDALLDDYSVNVSEDPSDANEVDVEIGLNVVDIIDTVDVDVTVGEITSSATVA